MNMPVLYNSDPRYWPILVRLCKILTVADDMQLPMTGPKID